MERVARAHRRGGQADRHLRPVLRRPMSCHSWRDRVEGWLRRREVPAPPEYLGLGWRQDEAGAWIALRITGAWLQAISDDAAEGMSEPSTETMPALARSESPAAAASSPVGGGTATKS